MRFRDRRGTSVPNPGETEEKKEEILLFLALADLFTEWLLEESLNPTGSSTEEDLKETGPGGVPEVSEREMESLEKSSSHPLPKSESESFFSLSDTLLEEVLESSVLREEWPVMMLRTGLHLLKSDLENENSASESQAALEQVLAAGDDEMEELALFLKELVDDEISLNPHLVRSKTKFQDLSSGIPLDAGEEKRAEKMEEKIPLAKRDWERKIASKHSFEHNDSTITATHLKKVYGKKVAVEDISLMVRRGEAVGLLGPNGAGKTTSFYIVAGFVKPTSGHILFRDKDITELPMYRRARLGITYLPQEASVFRSLTVEDNILAILEYRPDLSRRELRRIAGDLMERLEIARLAKQKAYTLSGGERRRTEIARALAMNPGFLLLDEPFAGIDPIAVSEIKKIIRSLVDMGLGILITDHNLRDTLDITDRAYIVNLGEVLVSGSREELLVSDIAREIYFGEDFSM